MIKGLKLTAALVAVGGFISLGYAAVAQQSQSPSDPTTQPANQQNQPAVQPTNSSTDGTTSSGLSAQDRQFMIQAAQGGMAEVKLGQLAVQRASSDSVKQYAQRMVDDHTQVNNELMQLAQQKSVTLPTDVNSQQKALRTRLGQLSGTNFDKRYIREAGVRAHSQQAALFQREIQQGQDSDVKAFAAKVLPAVKDHLQMARSMTGNTAAQNQNR
jgi:putative membrane protein